MSLKNKSILVTGGAGFIGSHLVDRLIEEKPEKIVVASNFYLGKAENLEEAQHKLPKLKIVRCDVADYEDIQDVVVGNGIEIVFNLSVIPLPTSLVKPEWTIRKNIEMTLNLCRLQREGKFKTLIQFSSSEAPGSAKLIPMNEVHPMDPETPYAASKAATDFIALSYHHTFGCDTAVIRPFNQYGPRQNAQKFAGIVPLTMGRILKSEPLIIYGDGEQTRDFCVTGDTLILMRNFTWKPIKDIKLNDVVISFDEHPSGKGPTFHLTKVKAINSYISSDVYEIKTEEGSIKATGNHPWLMDKRGYRSTKKIKSNISRYKNQKLRRFSEAILIKENLNYKKGYVYGSIIGDGHVGYYKYKKGSTYYVGLTSTDRTYRDVFFLYMKELGFKIKKYKQTRNPWKKQYLAISSYKNDYHKMNEFLKNPLWKNQDFCRGFIAGIFDSEGEYHKWQLRISNKNYEVIKKICKILKKFEFKLSILRKKSSVLYITVLGGLNEHVRFFSLFQPKINRKQPSLKNKILKGQRIRILSINKIKNQRVYNMEIEKTHTYIANSFLCHNTYVTDTADATIEVFKNPSTRGKVLNIASGKEISINFVVKKIAQLMNYAKPIVYKEARPGDVLRHCADITLAQELLGWQPKVSFEEGIIKTIEWYKLHPEVFGL